MNNSYWLSFVDRIANRFLGACIVEGESFLQAVENARKKGVNPGGEVLGTAIDPSTSVFIQARWRDRLALRNLTDERRA